MISSSCDVQQDIAKSGLLLLELQNEVEEIIDGVPPSLTSEDAILEEADKADLDNKSDGSDGNITIQTNYSGHLFSYFR